MSDDLRERVERAIQAVEIPENGWPEDRAGVWLMALEEAVKAADAALAEIGAVREAARVLLDSYDAFMAGKPENEHARAVSTAACFGAAAYEKGVGGQGVHALARSFLIALIDPSDAQLDYLRADPKSGETAREAVAALRAIVEGKE